MYYAKYRRHLKNLFEDLGIKKNALSHTGRKTFGSLLLKKGLTPKEISLLYGHSDIEMTIDHYLENDFFFETK